MFVATFKVKAITYKRKLISLGECPLSSLLNLPPVLASDEFRAGIHADVSVEILNLIADMARQSCNEPII